MLNVGASVVYGLSHRPNERFRGVQILLELPIRVPPALFSFSFKKRNRLFLGLTYDSIAPDGYTGGAAVRPEIATARSRCPPSPPPSGYVAAM